MSAEPIDNSLVQLDNEIAVAKADNPEMVPGRRDFLQYRELGVTKASEGKIRAQVTSASEGLSEETGWHVHLCEGQFVYMLSGWVDLEFAGGRKERGRFRRSDLYPGRHATQRDGDLGCVRAFGSFDPSRYGHGPLR